MNIGNYARLASLLLLLCCGRSYSSSSIDQLHTSSDGTYKAGITFNKQENYVLSITKHSKLQYEKELELLPEALLWLKDSHSLVVIEHLSSASIAEVFYLKGKNWVNYDADIDLTKYFPNQNRFFYYVVDAQKEANSIKFTYKINETISNINPELVKINTYLLTFFLNLENGTKSQDTLRPIDWKKYKDLPVLGRPEGKPEA